LPEADLYPRYPLPWFTGLRLLRDSLLRQSRSFREDAIQTVKTLSPQPRIINPNHIPCNGPCLLVINHYSRPGFGAWWIALGISAVVPVEIHWMMTAGWTHMGVLQPVTRWLFSHLARVYGFTTTPPMPPKPGEVEARAVAVRQVIRVSRSEKAVIGLVPEGRDFPGGILGQPPKGIGRFIIQLAKHCQRIIPVGVYEEAGFLCLNFGVPFILDPPSTLPPNERDQIASQWVMAAIANQLPWRLRGKYAALNGQ
jgi:hypothetical protein